MNSTFNRQFLLTDFRLLDNPDFLKFVGTSKYLTYLILRRNIWRGKKPHYMGLHKMYLQDRLLVCSLERKKISEKTGVEPDSISRQLTSLEEDGVLKRINTGRQNIYVLGEWVDVYENGSYRGVEWFYIDGKFGIEKADLSPSDSSDAVILSDQTPLPQPDQNQPSSPNQTQRPASDNNRESGREGKSTGTGSENRDETKPTKKKRKRSVLWELDDVDAAADDIEFTFVDITQAMPDSGEMERWYRLIARKSPAEEIREALSHIKAYPGDHAGKIFSAKMTKYAKARLKRIRMNEDEKKNQKQNNDMQEQISETKESFGLTV